MHKLLSGLILLGSLLYLLPIAQSATAQEQQEIPIRDPYIEQEILDRLGAILPEAVPIFQQATIAMDAGQYIEAKRAYEDVLQLVPGFPDAELRLSYVMISLRNFRAALEHAQNAFDADPSPYNHMAIAMALLSQGSLSPADRQSAYVHAKAAAEAIPDDFAANYALMVAAYYTENIEDSRAATKKVLEFDPKSPPGHYFAGLIAAYDGRWEKAEAELLLSQQLGIPAGDVEAVLSNGIRSQAMLFRTLRWGGYTLAGWVAGLAVLFLLGSLLSWLTLQAIKKPQRIIEYRIGRLERLVRWLYRLIILGASAYFYLSIPMIILLVIVGVAGVVYLFMTIGWLSLQLLVIAGISAFLTLFVVIRSIFTRIKVQEPGKSLRRGEAPSLWSLVEGVANLVGTRPVDAIYITPAAQIAVNERGSLLKRLRGSGKRSLILGLGAMDGLNQGQLKSILAHEYGHFINQDTAGGNIALQVQYSVNLMGLSLAQGDLAKWYNPAWLFIKGYYRIFLRITLGASRLQEVLADRHAALTYGGRNFFEGLLHHVSQSILFKFQVNAEIGEAIQANRRLSNLYSLPPPQTTEASFKIAAAFAEQMQRTTGPYDSHPSLRERIDLLKNYAPAPSSGAADDLYPAWDLLPNSALWQDEMTAVVQGKIDQGARDSDTDE